VIIFEFLETRGGVLTSWLTALPSKGGLDKKERTKLKEKLDRLHQADYELARTLIAGASKKKGEPTFPSLFKLQIGGGVALRPLLCYGPESPKREVTFLSQAFEVGMEWRPRGVRAEANQRRTALVNRTARRVEYVAPREQE
jgi:hypothetical protein